MHCINTKLQEYKDLRDSSGIDERTLKAKIAVWQEDNGLDNWPTLADLEVTDMLQKSSSTTQQPIKELETKLMSFLNKIGVKVESLPEGDFVAKAKLAERIIQVVQGKADASTLPEEASHFFVDILKANGVLFDKLMDEIEKNPIYQEVFERFACL